METVELTRDASGKVTKVVTHDKNKDTELAEKIDEMLDESKLTKTKMVTATYKDKHMKTDLEEDALKTLDKIDAKIDKTVK